MLTITEAVMADELPAVTAWAVRNGWTVDYDPSIQRGRAAVQHPAENDRTVVFWFDVAGYPDVQPPAWWCGGDGKSVTTNKADYPRPSANPPPGPPAGSIFHSNPVICAPWNRLAYGANAGPHTDWEVLAAWMTTGAGYTQAHTIADMLSQLDLHLRRSDGMQL